MTCNPIIVPYNLPPPTYKRPLKRRNWKTTGAIIGGTIGFLILVALVAAAVVLSGGAGAAATAAFVPTTKEVVVFGAFILTPL